VLSRGKAPSLPFLFGRGQCPAPTSPQLIFIVFGVPRDSAEAAMTLREGGRLMKDCSETNYDAPSELAHGVRTCTYGDAPARSGGSLWG